MLICGRYKPRSIPTSCTIHWNLSGCMPWCKSKKSWVILSMSLVVSCAIISQMSEWRQLKMSSNFVANTATSAWCVIQNRLPMALRSIQVWKKWRFQNLLSSLWLRTILHMGWTTNARTMWLVSKSCKEKGKSWSWSVIMGAGWKKNS